MNINKNFSFNFFYTFNVKTIKNWFIIINLYLNVGYKLILYSFN